MDEFEGPELDRRTILRMRRLTAEDRIALGLGLSATAIELAHSGGRRARRQILPKRS